MVAIPQEYDRLPIGRQITRKIDSRRESGTVKGLVRTVSPDWLSTYTVVWETPHKQRFEEQLALTTIRSYYSDSDAYLDQPFVSDEIRLLQQVCQQGCFGLFITIIYLAHMQPCSLQYQWDKTKCPKKDTEAWEQAVQGKLRGTSCTSKALAKAAKGRKASGSSDLPAMAAKNGVKSAEIGNSQDHQAKKQKTSNELPSGISRQVKQLTQHVTTTVSKAGDKLREAPQVLGQAISDALPNSSKKVSSSKATASTGTTGSAHPLTNAAQKAQEAIQAMSPARTSGTGTRATSNKKQKAPATRRSSARHMAPQVVTDGDTEQHIDIDDGSKVGADSGTQPAQSHATCPTVATHAYATAQAI